MISEQLARAETRLAMLLNRLWPYAAFFAFALTAAHRALCAAAIRRRPAIERVFLVGELVFALTLAQRAL